MLPIPLADHQTHGQHHYWETYFAYAHMVTRS